ncbi:alpha/beta hydrolase [Cyanobium sp. Cruz CV13-4-11]|jgi:esterase/lipase superfamily enzyme|uniref:alpha/beta hydrolase n=1 Tax=unclassified Cyanobium TaxID=2627006 RepID=UPI0020CF548C|nr:MULTISPECIES: alpha/beta hydrolase [unclassified Cyanobium]MCP9899591.1 alpha/beta hydrolase [Cyanobium sp. Cruz CV11-17]MCP9918662.1 alpha/beta hydrolase [Cyanobium sp. Cruz CV13-4-11]
MSRTIRYFATNRDRQKLGRAFDDAERIKLQRSGYHWIDTEICMAQYLGSTDPSSLPIEAVIAEAQREDLKRFLAKPCIRTVVIGIHGFNVPLHGAITSFSLLAELLQQQLAQQGHSLLMGPPDPQHPIDESRDHMAFIGFSWPSDGSVLAYQSDRNEATQSTAALANMIATIRTVNPGTGIALIAHSMGNYLTCNMLASLLNEESWPKQALSGDDAGRRLTGRLSRRKDNGAESFVDQYIMLAPDVERREVTQCPNVQVGSRRLHYNGPFYGGLKHLVGHTHLFYSRHDSALQASVLEKEALREPIEKLKQRLTGPELTKRWESSLGLNPLPSLAPPNMTGYNATRLTNRSIDHGDYFDAPAIISTIADLLLQPPITTWI